MRRPDGKKADDVKLVVVGSIGIDTVETKAARQENVLGGSLSYACLAAAFFTKVGMVGVVGEDFSDEYTALYRQFGIDLGGLQKRPGRTFRWAGVYEEDMDNRRTLSTELNVFEAFSPDLPDNYSRAPFFLLGNISPDLQLRVLSHARNPQFVAADTMDLWIKTSRDAVMEVISKVGMLAVNDSEARLLTGESNIKRAAHRILGWGPKYVVIKKGGHGAVLLSAAGISLIPAYPLDEVTDPTGAGDTFAGACMGVLARDGVVTDASVRRALLYGSVVASFGCQDFSVGRLRVLDSDAIEARRDELVRMTSLA
jgi:sugar/nucleoside kinase (ribokinase family)